MQSSNSSRKSSRKTSLDSIDYKTEEEENKKLIKQVVNSISTLLTDECQEGTEQEENQNESIEIFNSRGVNISIEDFLKRIVERGEIKNCSTIVLMLIYIDKLCLKYDVKLNSKNIHKIMLTAIFSAIKFNEDKKFRNEIYVKIFGINEKTLNKLEYTFLTLIDFDLFVDEKLYYSYFDSLLNIKQNEEETLIIEYTEEN